MKTYESIIIIINILITVIMIMIIMIIIIIIIILIIIIKIICSTCRVITMGKNCFENIHEWLNSLKMKCWYTTKSFISTVNNNVIK